MSELALNEGLLLESRTVHAVGIFVRRKVFLNRSLKIPSERLRHFAIECWINTSDSLDITLTQGVSSYPRRARLSL